MTEWLKVVDCKSIGLPIVGSNPTLFTKYGRNITQSGSVPVLGTGSHVFKSHYFELIFLFNNKKLDINKI